MFLPNEMFEQRIEKCHITLTLAIKHKYLVILTEKIGAKMLAQT
jgi:hypothetical protein